MKRKFHGATQPNQIALSRIASDPVASVSRSENRNGKPIGDLCLEIAEFAKDRDYRTLDYLLRMAAAEAYDQTSEILHPYRPGKNEFVGLWDWDVSQNLSYVDPPAAKLFDVNPKASVRGLPVEEYIKAIHPDDVKPFTEALYRVASEGGCFKATYRVINNDRIIWVYAKGSCFVGPGKTPVRFPGALFDVTASMTNS
jgi:PAS domain-containing protein